MKYLIDIGHPAHVHYFKQLVKILESKDHRVLFTCRKKEVTIELLSCYGFSFISFGKPFKGYFGKLLGLFWFTLRLFLVAIRFKPDIYLNASHYSAFVAWITRKPHIAIEDTYNMEQVRFYLPFTSAILTSNEPHPSLGYKEISYNGYQKLTYLHPNYFQKNPNSIEGLNVEQRERFVLLRFVSWNASHDFGHKGISSENKIKIVQELSKIVKVFISSEKKLPDELAKFELKIKPENFHHVISKATLVLGESATIATEAAILGVPAIYLDNVGRTYTTDLQDRYGLIYNYTESEEDQKKALSKALELLQTPGLLEEWKKKRDIMLSDKIDVTAFMVWFIENYPQSFKIMKENPDYQLRFK